MDIMESSLEIKLRNIGENAAIRILGTDFIAKCLVEEDCDEMILRNALYLISGNENDEMPLRIRYGKMNYRDGYKEMCKACHGKKLSMRQRTRLMDTINMLEHYWSVDEYYQLVTVKRRADGVPDTYEPIAYDWVYLIVGATVILNLAIHMLGAGC